MGRSELTDLEDEIGRITQRLAATVEELSFRLQPRELGRRTLAGAGHRARGLAGLGLVAAVGVVAVGLLAAARWRLRRR
ncbi:MAG: hypothetical protein ACRC0L_06985 [Angustibacter sp.]